MCVKSSKQFVFARLMSVLHTEFLIFYFIFILQDSPNITDINKTNTLQNLHTIQAGTSHRDNLQLWGPKY
jgi:hypothetical protein